MLNQFYQKKLKINRFLFCILISLLVIMPVYAQEADIIPEHNTQTKKVGLFKLENGFERYFFYTKYQIGGKTLSRQGFGYTYFPLSELEFPLDVFMIYTNLTLTLLDRITVHYCFKKNLHNRVGKMKDSDWIPYPGCKTIYSESDARLNAFINEVDLDVRLYTISFFSIILGAGFMHQYLYYWCSNVLQGDIIDSNMNFESPAITYIGGKVITYELQNYIFTMQIMPVFTIPLGKGFMQIIPSIRFSPYLRAKDIDDHILRGKMAKSDCKGSAFMPFLTIRYSFECRAFISARLEYLYITAKGKQNQSYYNPFLEPDITDNIPGWSARIESKIKSEQLVISLGAGYSFEF